MVREPHCTVAIRTNPATRHINVRHAHGPPSTAAAPHRVACSSKQLSPVALNVSFTVLKIRQTNRARATRFRNSYYPHGWVRHIPIVARKISTCPPFLIRSRSSISE